MIWSHNVEMGCFAVPQFWFVLHSELKSTGTKPETEPIMKMNTCQQSDVFPFRIKANAPNMRKLTHDQTEPATQRHLPQKWNTFIQPSLYNYMLSLSLSLSDSLPHTTDTRANKWGRKCLWMYFPAVEPPLHFTGMPLPSSLPFSLDVNGGKQAGLLASQRGKQRGFETARSAVDMKAACRGQIYKSRDHVTLTTALVSPWGGCGSCTGVGRGFRRHTRVLDSGVHILHPTYGDATASKTR